MRVRFRKDTIYRVYLAVFALVSVISVALLLHSQAVYHATAVARLEDRIRELEERPITQNVEFVKEENQEKQSPKKLEDLFWVEGTGINRHWYYMDIAFVDGYRARYYLHLPIKRGELINLQRRLDHDALVHYTLPQEEEKNFFAEGEKKFFFEG